MGVCRKAEAAVRKHPVHVTRTGRQQLEIYWIRGKDDRCDCWNLNYQLVAEALKAFEGYHSTLEMLDAFRYQTLATAKA